MLESPVVKSYLLRIELLYADRPIWRELWVPSNITLEFLHDVIQDSMGWDDAHMHCFEFQKRRFESMQFMDGFDEECEPEETVLLSDLLTRARQKLRYIYDFGDEWLHSVTLKKQVSALNDQDLYVCVGGEGACPMEDCGGTYGHERICNYLKTGVDDGFMPYEEWGVNEYDPDAFDAAEVTEDLKEMVEEFESFDQELDQIFGEEDKDDIFTAGLPGPSGPRGAGGFLPGFEEAFEEDEGDGTPEPYLNLSNEDQKLFREVMDAADAVHAIAPWKDLWDQDIFCIKDPQTGLLDFVSILGAGGEVFALHVHHGMEGYHLWQKTMLGTMPMDWKCRLSQRSLSCSNSRICQRSMRLGNLVRPIWAIRLARRVGQCYRSFRWLCLSGFRWMPRQRPTWGRLWRSRQLKRSGAAWRRLRWSVAAVRQSCMS